MRTHPFISSLTLINKTTDQCLISTNKALGKVFLEIEPGNYELKTTIVTWIYHNANESSISLSAKPNRIIMLMPVPDSKAQKWLMTTKEQSNNAFRRMP